MRPFFFGLRIPLVSAGFPPLGEAGDLGHHVAGEQPIGKIRTGIAFVNLTRHRQRQTAGFLFPVRLFARLAAVITTQ